MRRFVFLTMVALVMAVVLASPAWAATFTVDRIDDPDLSTTPTADDCTDAANDCSLRGAISAANANAGDDTIDIGVSGVVNLTAALPDLSTNIEIVGPGADQFTVTRPDTAENFRIFTVTGDTTVVTISGMTISNGNVVDNTDGGGILIADSGTLTVTDSTITGNFTEDSGAGIAIDVDTDGTLTVTGSTITDNTAESDNGGGISNAGTGTVTVTDSTITGNFTGHEGGGLANDGDGTLTVTGSTIGPDNSSDSEGGGIYNAGGGTLTVTGSTITDNSTNSDGGGIYNGGTLTVTDSTISGNTSHRTNAGQFSFGGEGGGIHSTNDIPDTDPANDPDETTTITNSTISGNTVTGEGAIGGGVYNSFGLTVIKNSTITKNTAPDGRGSGVASRGNEEIVSTEVLSSIISANTNTDVDFFTDFGTPTNTFLSRGYNLIGDGNATGAFNQTTDLPPGSDPKLDPLDSYGGPTQTHRLQSDSPAIDAGPPTDGDPIACPPPLTDQRGVERPQDGDADSTAICDIGSFELEVEEPENQAPTVTVDGGGSCGAASDMRGTINLTLADPDNPPDSLTLTATSSNRSVLPNRNISLGGGTDASRTMTVSSLTGSGTSNVTITLSDGDLQGTVLVMVISGSAANNTLTGSTNADMIFARKGSDTVSGQGANDLMCGGNGRDTLTGGDGADHFGGGSGTDTATDFNAGQGDTMAGIP